MFNLGPQEMLVFGVIAVLLFGKRLPEVGRSLGKGLIEFKKGLRDIQSDVEGSMDTSDRRRASHRNDIDDYEETTAPKFEPPKQEPQASAENSTASSLPSIKSSTRHSDALPASTSCVHVSASAIRVRPC